MGDSKSEASSQPESDKTPVATGPTNTTPNSKKPGNTDRLAKPWRVSEKLLSFLGIWENGVENGKNFAKQQVTDGFILTVYNDSRKLPTVGCGHLVTTEDKLKVGDKITKEKAQELLKNDLKIAENAINNKTKVPLFQYEYDALVSIAFNTGATGASKLIDKVNEGEYNLVPDEIEKYRTGGGNKGRRASEAKLFKTGVYDATH
ncbi:MAG: glycoside hydrolase family 24 [Proteobacteria bacterium]|nr:glycoside hydrolase family 24 [Pseudomonadota bacterium]